MKAATYAEALYRATQGTGADETDRMIGRMLELVRARGHERLLPRIAHELERITRARGGAHTVVIRVAREADRVQYGARVARDVQTLHAASCTEHLVIDPTAIGGYEVRCDGVAIDRTYKRALTALYRTLITP